ncbi:MAG: PocR ligand-binding domain-containing protein [Clostridia bacterium]|nr:PocR ligand-binding domain-containing protein [Clostridia bacterium]
MLKYDLDKLESAIHDFNLVTGISITLYSPDELPITSRGTSMGCYCKLVASTKYGARACKHSNRALISECRRTKRITRHICGAGLLDIAIPLLHHGDLVGFIMIGQIKMQEQLPAEALSFPIEPAELEACYRTLPLYNEQLIASTINIATMLTRYILLENMVVSQQKPSASVIAEYIEAHLSERLTAAAVSLGTHISVSGIYKCMKQSYGCTLSEYICSRRIERAVTLLETTELSIEKVADAVGFSDAAYFSRCFKRTRGLSPLKYRKEL